MSFWRRNVSVNPGSRTGTGFADHLNSTDTLPLDVSTGLGRFANSPTIEEFQFTLFILKSSSIKLG